MFRSLMFVGAAVAGGLAVAVATPDSASAAKFKSSISCDTDDAKIGHFQTNTKNHQKVGGDSNYDTDVIAVAGGFGVLKGGPLSPKYHSLTRGLAIAGSVPDLETRTDFPVTVNTLSIAMLENETIGSPFKGGTMTVRSFQGTSSASMTIDSYKDLGKKGKKHLAQVTGRFSGTIPSFTEPSGLTVTNGTFSATINVFPK